MMSRIAMLTTNSNTKPILSGGPLNGEYEFAQLHFHWGDDDNHGSEDEIDGKSYPMEIHFVFFKKEYLNSDAALDHPDGLCVIACLFEVNKKKLIKIAAMQVLISNFMIRSATFTTITTMDSLKFYLR